MVGSGAGGIFSPSPTADYPPWIEEAHTIWMSDMQAFIDAAVLNNPYAGVVGWDPSDEVTNLQNLLELYTTDVAAISPTSDYTDFVTSAISIYDSTINPSSYVDDMMEVFDEDQSFAVAKNLGRLGAIMAQANAVDNGSSSYLMAAALLLRGAGNERTAYRTQLDAQYAQARTSAVLGIAGQLSQFYNYKIEAGRNALAAQMQTSGIIAGLERDQLNDDITYSVADSQWEMQQYTYGGNLLASVGGAAVIPTGPSVAGSALVGALNGAVGAIPLALTLGGINPLLGVAAGVTFAGLGAASSAIANNNFGNLVQQYVSGG